MTKAEQHIGLSSVACADGLVDDCGRNEFLRLISVRCADGLGVEAIGFLLADQAGVLNIAEASSDRAQALGLLELRHGEGPSFDCFRDGGPVHCPDLSVARQRWPWFSEAAIAAEFRSLHSLPMRLRAETVGTLTLLATGSGNEIGEDTVKMARALSDVAAVGILHQRVAHDRAARAEQLQTALNSRILTEQAKGVLAERLGVSVAEAFHVMRSYARRNNLRLREVGSRIVHGGRAITDRPDFRINKNSSH